MHPLFGNLDAVGFALFLAAVAAHALAFVNDRAEHGKAGEETEGGAHRADVVAPGAATAEGEHGNDHQRHCGNDQGRNALEPDFLLIEGIAFEYSIRDRNSALSTFTFFSEIN